MANKNPELHVENLTHVLTDEDRKKAAEGVRRYHKKRKNFKLMLELLGANKSSNFSQTQIKKFKRLGFDVEKDITADLEKMFLLEKMALKGDLRALDIILKIRGELAPQKNINENHNITPPKPLEDLTKNQKEE